MPEQDKKIELTSRQKEILSLLRKGLTNIEICKTLGISANTVKVHLANIYKILEVTNRTEAVSTNFASIGDDDVKKDLNVIFYKKNDITAYPKAYSLYLSIVEAFHQYRIFRIEATTEISTEPGFWIDVSASKDKDETLFISTRIGSSHENLWTTSIKINTDDIHFLAKQSVMQLFRSIVLASAKLKYSSKSPIPYWWYASTSSIIKFESRNKESFEACKEKLEPLVKGNNYNEFTLYVLSFILYVAIIENWSDTQRPLKELGELARKSMFNAPYSIYSQMVMAFYNIVLGNKSEAVTYLKQVIEANPQAITARTVLIQIYMLTGQEDEALKLIDEFTRLIPESAIRSFVCHARVLILLLQGKYDECKSLAQQILLFTPKALVVRLAIIASCNMTNDVAESKFHTQKLFEYNPKLTKKDVEQLLKGVAEKKKASIMESISNIFPQGKSDKKLKK